MSAATSPSVLQEVSGYHTGGRDVEKTFFPSPSAHLPGGSGFKPHDRQKKLAQGLLSGSPKFKLKWKRNGSSPKSLIPKA